MNSKHPPAADVMERTWYRFRVRQRVHYYSEGRASKKMTGPWTVLGVVKQPGDGEVRYRIKTAQLNS